MKTHRVNKGGQTPQRAPRTPGVRCQELHLCANGTGLGIRDYQIPNYKQLPDLFVRRDQGDFWVSPCSPSPVPSEAEGYRDSSCLLGKEVGRGGPPINRQPTWPSSPGQSMHLPADSCTSLGVGQQRAQHLTQALAFSLAALALRRGYSQHHILGYSSPQDAFPCFELLQQLQVHSANVGVPVLSDSASRAGVRTAGQPRAQYCIGMFVFGSQWKAGQKEFLNIKYLK